MQKSWIFHLILVIILLLINPGNIMLNGAVILTSCILYYMLYHRDTLEGLTNDSESESDEDSESDEEPELPTRTYNLAEDFDINSDPLTKEIIPYAHLDYNYVKTNHQKMGAGADNRLFNRMKYTSIQPQIAKEARARYNKELLRPFIEEELKLHARKDWWETMD